MTSSDILGSRQPGADSVTWRVLSHPASIVGGLRALLIQTLHPHAMAGVAQHSDYRSQPFDRLASTARYVWATATGDPETVQRAVDRVRAVHDHINGFDPVTGQHYSAHNPETQLWVHCTEWHSFAAAYQVFGPGLTDAEFDTYLAEGQWIGSLLGTPINQVPASRQQYRDYFATERPRLCATEATRQTVEFVTHAKPRWSTLAFWLPQRVLARAAVATIPHHLRNVAGMNDSRVLDALTLGAVKPVLFAGWIATTPGTPLLPRMIYRILEKPFGREVAAMASRARRQLPRPHRSR